MLRSPNAVLGLLPPSSFIPGTTTRLASGIKEVQRPSRAHTRQGGGGLEPSDRRPRPRGHGGVRAQANAQRKAGAIINTSLRRQTSSRSCHSTSQKPVLSELCETPCEKGGGGRHSICAPQRRRPKHGGERRSIADAEAESRLRPKDHMLIT